MALLLFFAFLAGFVTILAPCIWPLLPIILSASATGKGHRRPLGITLGIMLSFTLFTLGISYLVKLFNLDADIIRLFAVIVLIFLGLTLIVPALSQITEALVSRLSGRFGRTGMTGSDFGSGLITGLSLGLVWSPCAGPILASIAALAATGKVTTNVILVTLAYVIGIGIPLFLFAYGGQKLVANTRFLSKHTARIQQIFGVFMLLTAVAIFTNVDKVIQLKLLDLFPAYTNTLTNLERNDIVSSQLNNLKKNATQSTVDAPELNANSPAPEFTGISHWLNTDQPLTLKQLRGKVVLVDFWTYTCINCIRTLPYVTSWYEKYKDQGFVVVGVHTPEFAFEHDTTNVQNALKQYKITYPVAQDNDYATWNAYNNEYWPAHYLIDANGIIRQTHFGEGEYEATEKAIQILLKQAGKKVSAGIASDEGPTISRDISPETYLGSRRMQYFYPSSTVQDGTNPFVLEENIPENTFSLGGTWTITPEQAVSGQQASLVYNFTAQNVYLVLRPGSAKTASVKVYIDNKPVSSDTAGKDVHDGGVTVDTDRLYHLINLQGKTENHILKIEFQTPGTQAFAFTFG